MAPGPAATRVWVLFTLQLLVKGTWAPMEGSRIRPILSVPTWQNTVDSSHNETSICGNTGIADTRIVSNSRKIKTFLVWSLMGEWLRDGNISFHFTLFPISKFLPSSVEGTAMVTPFFALLGSWHVPLLHSPTCFLFSHLITHGLVLLQYWIK